MNNTTNKQFRWQEKKLKAKNINTNEISSITHANAI